MAQMQVFVSHNHHDTAFCQALVEGLRDAGADVWYDEHNMGSGRLGPTIERELRRRPVFVVVLSPDALQSQWVEDETRWAYGLLRKDPARIIQPVTARAISEDDIWLFLQDFKRIEAGGYQPYPLDEAIRRLLHALALTPAHEAPAPTAPQPAETLPDLLERGNALSAQQRYTEALTLIERALALNQNSSAAWNNKGNDLIHLGRPEEGLSALERALALDPTFAAIWNNKGNALYALQRPEEALNAYDRALALDPRYADAWNGKGAALHSLQRLEEALIAYDHALGLEPNFAFAWGNHGRALHVLGRYEEALQSYERGLNINSNYPNIWHNKAIALRELGRTAEAEAAWRRAQELGG